MNISPWSVALISTGYDLKDLRSILAESISKIGFDVLAYELPGYPIEPKVHSHDACIHAIKQSHIVILIIDKRYGGFYIGSTGYSITEEEYNEAVKQQNKIIIPCVRERAWNERFQKFNTVKSLGISLDNAKSTIKTSYVDNWEVLEFIERVRKADVDNWVITFDDPIEIRNKIKSRLEGISRYILELITKEQKKLVESIKTSTGMDLSLGDVLSKGYYVDPPFKVITGPKSPEKNVIKIFEKIIDQKFGMALYGGTGSGKSTLIAKAFLEHANYCIDNKAVEIPFFISLRGKGYDYEFSVNSVINESLNELLQKKEYPAFKLTGLKPVFYMDGFDELSEDIQQIDLQKVANSEIFNSSFILTCRLRYARDYLNEITLGNKLNYIVELSSWGVELAVDYINKFCEIHGRKKLADDLIKYFRENAELETITSNPLLLTLFLWVVEMAGMTLPLDIKNQTNLFDRCIDLWIKRDIARLGKNGTEEGRNLKDHIKKGWKFASWEIYKSRYSPEKSPLLSHLQDRLTIIDQDLKKVCSNEAFLGILEINTFTNRVKGMIHEPFLEHLVAYSISEGMKNSMYPYPESLDYVIRPEINRIIRAIWNEQDESFLTDTAQNLWNIYLYNLASDDTKKIFRRNQAAYYIGRLDNDISLEKLREAKDLEKNTSVILSISFGLIKKGDFQEEESLYEKLKTESEWDIANRGYHMVYYRDLKAGEPPYRDPGNIEWNNTLNALLRHLESHEKRHLTLRRVELFTIRRFVETRKNKGPVTDEIMKRIDNAMNEWNDLSSNEWVTYFKKVKQELQALKKSWNSY